MKFVLAYTICSAITGMCNTPVVHPQHFNTWTDCTKHGAIVTIGVTNKYLKKFNDKDFLLCTGDPAIIGITCSLVSDITNGKYNLLKWDKQERTYYPIAINLHEKGEIDGN